MPNQRKVIKWTKQIEQHSTQNRHINHSRNQWKRETVAYSKYLKLTTLPYWPNNARRSCSDFVCLQRTCYQL